MISAVHPTLAAAFDALDRAGITWALLRGGDDLAAPTGDVDVLVERGAWPRAGRVLVDAGLAHLRTWAQGSQMFFVASDPDTAWAAIVQVVDELSFGPYACFVADGADALLAARVDAGGRWVLDEGDEGSVTLLHCLLDKGGVTDKHRARLSALPSLSPRVRVPDAVRATLEARWTERDALAGPVRAAWWRAAPVACARRYVVNRASLVARKLAEPVTRPGLVVAVLAPDGAGKSTLVSSLAADAGLFPVRRFYAGAYGAQTNARTAPVPGLRFATRVALLASAGWRGRWHRRRRRIALYDRHPMEIEGPGLRRKVLARLVPAPDLLLVLDAPAEELHRRSGEHDVARLDALRARYAALAARTPGAVVIDATRPPAAVAAAARAAIRARLVARWRA